MKEIFNGHVDEWNLDNKQVSKAVQLVTNDGAEGVVSHHLLCRFLYAKTILDKELPIVRKAKFDQIMNASNNAGTETYALRAYTRLHTIVLTGERSPKRTEFEPPTLFDSFLQQHPEWKDGWVAHRNHKDLAGKDHALVERYQKSGLCYMHASVVLQHYLVAMQNTQKKHMSGESLYEHIWNDRGGDSFDFLKHILAEKPNPKNIIKISYNDFVSADISKLLEEHGPALVTGFRCTKGFVSDEWQHLGKYDDEEFLGRHAMVLVGHRLVDGETRYLVQNWWEKKPYFEVDIDYLLSSDASLYFITEKQLKMGAYPESYEQLVECDVGMDAPENFLLDGPI